MAVEPETFKSEARADGTLVLESQRGAVRLSRLAPSFLMFICRGTLSVKFHPDMIAFTQREMDAGERLGVFVDGWDLNSVDTDFREAWTEWFRRHRQRFGMRLLVRTQLMEMAASISNLLTGREVVKTYSSVAAWEADCVAELPAFRRPAE